MLVPSPYRGEQDLPALQDLLRAGQRANPRLTYVHPGDIEWWFYYNPVFVTPEDGVHLWHTDAGEMAAWTLHDVKDRTFDLFVHPNSRTETVFDFLLAWLNTEFQTHPSDEDTITCEMCFRADEMFAAALNRAGYTASPFLALFEQTLHTPPVPVLPHGFRFLEAVEERHIDSRAWAHNNAFSREGRPSRMTPEYYRQFITAPGYDPTLDIAVVNEQDDIVAFAMAWADPVTQRGEFEPVGTRKDYQRRGLGRAALLEGLRRLYSRGITIASVATWIEDADNMAFYPSAGFEIVGSSDHYKKPASSQTSADEIA